MTAGKFLEEQMEDPIELCHFERIDENVKNSQNTDEELSCEFEYDKAYLMHIFCCKRRTGNPKVLPLMADLGISVTDDEEAALSALSNRNEASGAGMSPAHWIALGKFYAETGFDVYLSENMMEVYPHVD